MKRLIFAMTLLLLLPLNGAFAKPKAQTAPMTAVGDGEGEVDIVAWAGYIERGDNDKNYDWVTKFEKDTGCTVNVKIAGTSDEMVSLMSQSAYDLVTASGDASLRLVAGGVVQPVNIDLIPSFKTIDERLQNGAWHTVKDDNGNMVHYGVPYQWGANVLMYNTKIFGDKPPTSWSVVFEETTLPDGKSNAGRVQAYDGPIYIADAALYLKAHNPDLKITDPYELDQTQFDAAIALLKSQRKLVSRYWHDVTAQIDDFTNEGMAASSSWPYQVNLLKADNQPIESVIPDEGATGWADTTMMNANAPHPNCAYKWMEHSLDPKVQGDVASWFGSVPVVPAACDGNDLLGKDGCKINGIDNFDKISFWRTPTKACGDDRGDVCIPYSDWSVKYVEIIGST